MAKIEQARHLPSSGGDGSRNLQFLSELTIQSEGTLQKGLHFSPMEVLALPAAGRRMAAIGGKQGNLGVKAGISRVG